MADRRQGGSGVIAGRDRHLALAVVAETSRLQDRRRAESFQRGDKIAAVAYLGPGRDVDAATGHEGLFSDTILRDGQRLGPWPHRHDSLEKCRRVYRHVLELVGDDIDLARERFQMRQIGIAAVCRAAGDVERRAMRIVGIHVRLEAEAGSGVRQHACELAAAENADGAAGRQGSVALVRHRSGLVLRLVGDRGRLSGTAGIETTGQGRI